MGESTAPARLDLPAARRWALTARAMLAEARPRIDSLNVFPVPDGDTGTNLLLTVDGALDMLRERPDLAGEPLRLHEGLGLIARGMLLSARGNSGVILSQLARGLHEAVAEAGPAGGCAGPRDDVGPQVLADAFVRADALAWAGVTTPVEGTILSVSRAAASGAVTAAARAAVDVLDVVQAALSGAREALERTPQQLPVLAQAGVVDAGGAGFVIVIEALEQVLSGRTRDDTDQGGGRWTETTTTPPSHRQGCEQEGDGAHEVMYLLTGSDPGRAQHLRAHLAQVGSSVLVVGGPQEWRVHVHLDDPRVALEAGAMAGHVEGVTVTALRPAASGAPLATASGEPAGPSTHRPRQAAVGVVACAAGPGLAALFARAGAEVVRSAPGARASTGQLLNAICAVDAGAVVVLPNDPDTLLAADAAASAARQEGLTAVVVPSRAAVQGLAALAVLHPDQEIDPTVAAMREAVDATGHGAVTSASKDGITPVGPCRAGQALGLVAGEITAVHDAPEVVARAVLEHLVQDGTELLTVVAGAVADRAGLQPVVDDVVSRREDVVVEWLEGGQGTFTWLFGAE